MQNYRPKFTFEGHVGPLMQWLYNQINFIRGDFISGFYCIKQRKRGKTREGKGKSHYHNRLGHHRSIHGSKTSSVDHRPYSTDSSHHAINHGEEREERRNMEGTLPYLSFPERVISNKPFHLTWFPEISSCPLSIYLWPGIIFKVP